MILGQISWADCFVFLIFLAPQLLLQINLIELLTCAFHAVPFLVLVMPYQLISERYLTHRAGRSPFVQHASLFQDVVIRCVRYAFARIPASIGKVFFSKGVALPFFTFRKLRHGILRSPIHWEEVNEQGLKGIWIAADTSRPPDIAILYCHGGGFSMGSAHFYLEFLLAWVSLLWEAGYANPALFALEYTLVPEAKYPTQVVEAARGYDFVLRRVGGDGGRVVVGGDSAGATLVLSLLLEQARGSGAAGPKPALAVPISPWTSIISDANADTSSDYLNADSLRLYGSQYLGGAARETDPVASPGTNRDLEWWRKASPGKGWYFIYGAEEVFAPEARRLVALLRKVGGVDVEALEEKGWIHAWPVVKLFLSDTQQERQSGLRNIVKVIRERMPPDDGTDGGMKGMAS